MATRPDLKTQNGVGLLPFWTQLPQAFFLLTMIIIKQNNCRLMLAYEDTRNFAQPKKVDFITAQVFLEYIYLFFKNIDF